MLRRLSEIGRNGGSWPLTAATAVVLLAAGVAVWAAYGSWSLSGFPGRSVSYVAVDSQSPTTVYASMGQGLYQSTDGGYTWSTTNFPVASPIRVAIDTATTPHTVYAGALADIKVYKGTDNAGTWNWTSSGSGIAGASFVAALAVDASTTPSTILVGTGNALPYTNKGVYYSTNGGQNWTAASGFPTQTIPFLGTRPNISQCTVLLVDPAHAGTVYAGFLTNGVYKSTNDGHSWSKATGCPIGAVAAMTFDPSGTLWVAGASASITAGPFSVYKTSDGGATWHLALSLGISSIPYSITADSLGRVYVGMVTPGTVTGVYVTDNGGSSWGNVKTGLGGSTVLALAAGSGTVYAGVGSAFLAGGDPKWGLYFMHYTPVVWNISPTGGPTTGGTNVTITGTDFSGATDVKFGSVSAASFTVDSDTQITVFSPSQPAGTVDVTVTAPAPDGTSATTAADQFTYTCPTFTFDQTLPDATVGVPYSGSVLASGGTAPYTYSVLPNSLPPGLSLDSNTGAITGTASATGNYTFMLDGKDSNGCTGSQSCTLNVVCPTITVSSSPSPVPSGAVGDAYGPVTFTATGSASGSHSFSTSGSLPPGLTLVDNQNGTVTLTGTPTAAGAFSFSVIATDGYGCKGSLSVNLYISLYDTSLQDDYGRSEMCFNKNTGNWSYTILAGNGAGQSFTGTGTIFKYGGYLRLMATPGSSSWVTLLDYTMTHQAMATFTYQPKGVITLRSALYDGNTLNDTATCGGAPPPMN